MSNFSQHNKVLFNITDKDDCTNNDFIAISDSMISVFPSIAKIHNLGSDKHFNSSFLKELDKHNNTNEENKYVWADKDFIKGRSQKEYFSISCPEVLGKDILNYANEMYKKLLQGKTLSQEHDFITKRLKTTTILFTQSFSKLLQNYNAVRNVQSADIPDEVTFIIDNIISKFPAKYAQTIGKFIQENLTRMPITSMLNSISLFFFYNKMIGDYLSTQCQNNKDLSLIDVYKINNNVYNKIETKVLPVNPMFTDMIKTLHSEYNCLHIDENEYTSGLIELFFSFREPVSTSTYNDNAFTLFFAFNTPLLFKYLKASDFIKVIKALKYGDKCYNHALVDDKYGKQLVREHSKLLKSEAHYKAVNQELDNGFIDIVNKNVVYDSDNYSNLSDLYKLLFFSRSLDEKQREKLFNVYTPFCIDIALKVNPIIAKNDDESDYNYLTSLEVAKTTLFLFWVLNDDKNNKSSIVSIENSVNNENNAHSFDNVNNVEIVSIVKEILINNLFEGMDGNSIRYIAEKCKESNGLVPPRILINIMEVRQ